MTHHVQEFIESTIDLIEKKEYHQAFTIWYIHYYDSENDKLALDELFNIFSTAGLDIYTDSAEARKDIIAEHMYDYIDDVLANDPDVSEIILPDVIRHLNSKLSISLLDLNNLFKDVTASLLGRYDIVRLPFKIQRRR